MTTPAEIARQLDHNGYLVIPRRLGPDGLAAARAEIGDMLAKARCMDRAALDPLASG